MEHTVIKHLNWVSHGTYSYKTFKLGESWNIQL